MALTLHYHPLASFCWKVLIALYEADAPFESVIVDLGEEGSRAAFLTLAPLGKMPVLVDAARQTVVPEIDHRHRICRRILSWPQQAHSGRRGCRLAHPARRPLL